MLKLKAQFVLMLVGLMLMFIVGTAQAQEPGNALDFDGVDDTVTVVSSPPIEITGSLTLEAWVFYRGGNRLIDKTTVGNTDGYMIDIVGQKLRIISGCTAVGATTLALNTWYHLAGVHDSVTGCKVYVNGVLDGTAPVIANFTSAATLRLGVDSLGANLFDGQMDNARIWNRALSQAEIVSRFKCTSSSPTTSLVASFNFNQGTGGGINTGITTLFDQSGNNNNMTLANFALTGATSNWVSSGALITGACPGSAVGGVAQSIAPSAGYPVATMAGMVIISVMLMSAGAWLMRRA